MHGACALDPAQMNTDVIPHALIIYASDALETSIPRPHLRAM